MPLLLWLLPLCVIPVAIHRSLIARRLGFVHRNALLTGLAAASIAMVVLHAAGLQKLWQKYQSLNGLLIDWRLPSISAIATIYACAGGWSLCILFLRLRSDLQRVPQDPRCPSWPATGIAAATIVLLAGSFGWIAVWLDR